MAKGISRTGKIVVSMLCVSLFIVLISTILFVSSQKIYGCYTPWVAYPPTVSITYPSNNNVFTTGGNITIEVNASRTDYAIDKVEFYKNAESIPFGISTSAPYSYKWTNIPAGTYTLKAKIYDTHGLNRVSTSVNITVRNLPDTSIIGKLLAGSGATFPDGVVSKYLGGSNWEQISPPNWNNNINNPNDLADGLEAAVLSLCEYNGNLYAGIGGALNGFGDLELPASGSRIWKGVYNSSTGTYTWTKTHTPVNDYYYNADGTTTWRNIDMLDNLWSCEAPLLAVYNGSLYAAVTPTETVYYPGSDPGTRRWGRLYKLTGDAWGQVVETAGGGYGRWDMFSSIYPYNNNILCIGGTGPYNGNWYTMFGHYTTGTNFITDNTFQDIYDRNVTDYTVYNDGSGNKLYACAGRDIYRSNNGINWEYMSNMVLGTGNSNGAWNIETFKNKLYVTEGPYLKRWDAGGWTSIWKAPYALDRTDFFSNQISITKTDNALILGVVTQDFESGYPGWMASGVYVYDGTNTPQLISERRQMGDGIFSLLLHD